tara:strand:+ start:4564 stop:4821 length:258 start_codon:yes stop_codon:yes gene_type:complete
MEGLKENWTAKISDFLVGKTVRHIRYMTAQEVDDLGWTKSNIVIEFDDGHWLVPMMDDEGNDAGALWSSEGKQLSIIPVIQRQYL